MYITENTNPIKTVKQGCPVSVVVVVYNTHCKDSSTCQSLLQLADVNIQVVIYDNSTKDYGNKVFCEQNRWIYLGGKGNDGLSKAYNSCIDAIRQNQKNGLVCLFDDDTQISDDYFQKLCQAAETSSSKIFVPLIYSEEALLSPCILTSWNNTQLFSSEEEVYQYTGQNITAINSGMAIRLSVFDTYRYDEKIFLDGIDHKFIRDMTKRGEHLCVFPFRCRHAFSGHSMPPLAAAKKRYEIFAKDQRYIFRSQTLKYCYLAGKRAVKLSLQYKSAAFAACFIKNLLGSK